jgi:hypothetical protein
MTSFNTLRSRVTGGRVPARAVPPQVQDGDAPANAKRVKPFVVNTSVVNKSVAKLLVMKSSNLNPSMVNPSMVKYPL